MNKNQTVFVGLSGGVDSSVAAHRLKNQGYNVVGVFIKVWHPDFMICNWEQERLDAMRVAAHLDIPFLTCDAESTYRDHVANYFIEEYKSGRTPNPDVMCNKQVKFGAFLDFALSKGADYIATGHYARKVTKDESHELHRGVDQNKDQTYFLWTLTNQQLEKTLFPVGDTDKDEIRKEAELAGIPTAIKKDSQGICFLGHVDIPTFLSHYVTLKKGDVLSTDGSVIGEHDGSFVYTLGQRHGFLLHNYDATRTPMYVISKNLNKNTITVDTKKLMVESDNLINLEQVTLRTPVKTGETIEAQFRYRQQPFKVKVHQIEDASIKIQTTTEQERPAVGQSCVLYRGDHCLGGGIIS